MIRIRRQRVGRICQGDIFRDVAYIEYVLEKHGIIEVSKINFPLVIVLTQDCDLAQDFRVRSGRPKPSMQDKWLLSVLVAPLYNVEHVYAGQHLSELNLKMQKIDKKATAGNRLRQNDTPRYHFLQFPVDLPLVDSVIDFKHYFSVNVEQLRQIKRTHFVCRVSELYREDIAQRFAAYLSRIGLPEPSDSGGAR